jgi:hypothetical protein
VSECELHHETIYRNTFGLNFKLRIKRQNAFFSKGIELSKAFVAYNQLCIALFFFSTFRIFTIGESAALKATTNRETQKSDSHINIIDLKS